MGFLDRARAMADELAQKADTALAGSGLGGPTAGAERYLRDLGVIAYLEASGRPVPVADRDRVLAALRELDQRGQIGSLTVQTTAEQPATPPPPPGAAAAQAGSAPPPPAPHTSTAPVEPPPAPTQPAPSTDTSTADTPPPPPPSWAKGD